MDGTLSNADRLVLGHALRALRPSWREGCFLGALLHRINATCEDVVSGYSLLTDAIHQAALDNCWEWRPPVDGHRLMELLGVKGRAIGAAQRAVIDWQLLHPTGSASDCERWLLEESEWGRAGHLTGVKRTVPEPAATGDGH